MTNLERILKQKSLLDSQKEKVEKDKKIMERPKTEIDLKSISPINKYKKTTSLCSYKRLNRD